ncbi:MAG: glycosyltransferase family 87 protein [Bacteroidota bacterium]
MFIFTIRPNMDFLKNKFFLLVPVLAAVIYCYIEAEGKGDFYIFMSAAGDLSAGKDVYRTSYAGGYNYFYSVFFALVLRFFYAMPFFWMKFYWLLLNLFLYCHLFQLLAGSAMVNRLATKQKQWFLVLVFIFSFRFFHENIHTSQITILILWCCIYGICLIQRDRVVSGSAILALGINIKLLPLVFLPYLFYRGYFKALFFTILFYFFALFSPSLIIGHDYNMSLLKSWLELINPLQQRHVLDVDERSFHSLSTLLSTLLVKEVPDTFAMDLKRNIADISLPALAKVLLAVRLALVGLTLYFMRWKPFVKAPSLLNNFIEISYILLLIPLIFPHQQHYAFLFMAPAFALILFSLMYNFKNTGRIQRQLLVALLALIYLVANLKILFGEFNRYYEHFKILTYAALLLIPLLIWVVRENKKNPLKDF